MRDHRVAACRAVRKPKPSKRASRARKALTKWRAAASSSAIRTNSGACPGGRADDDCVGLQIFDPGRELAAVLVGNANEHGRMYPEHPHHRRRHLVPCPADGESTDICSAPALTETRDLEDLLARTAACMAGITPAARIQLSDSGCGMIRSLRCAIGGSAAGGSSGSS